MQNYYHSLYKKLHAICNFHTISELVIQNNILVTPIFCISMYKYIIYSYYLYFNNKTPSSNNNDIYIYHYQLNDQRNVQ